MDAVSKLHRELKSFQGVWPGGYCGGGGGDDLRNFSGTFDHCLRPFASGATVLEIGPGRGYWTKRIAELEPKRIYCLDALSAAVNQFWQHVGRQYRTLIEYHQVSDFECHGIPDNSIDLLFSYDVYCHISLTGIDAYLRHLRAKLKPGAHCFVMIADADKYRQCCPNSNFVQLGDGQYPQSYDGPASPGRWYWVGQKRFTDLLSRYGYQVVQADIGVNPRDPICHFRAPDSAPADDRHTLNARSLPVRDVGLSAVVALPVLDASDIALQLRTVRLLQSAPRPSTAFEILFLAPQHLNGYQRLADACQRLATTHEIQVSLHHDHSEHARAALFWQAMNWAAKRPDDEGFVVWMEPDVLPAKPDWLDRLAVEWRAAGDCAVMGQFLTQLPDYLGGAPLPPHINAAACYAKHLANIVPSNAQAQAPFDLSVSDALESMPGRIQPSVQFALSNANIAVSQVTDERIALLHAHAQPACLFHEVVSRELSPATTSLRASSGEDKRFGGLAISYSLFGDAPKYNDGMLANARLASHVYPSARIRVYHDHTANPHLIAQLRVLGCELIDMTGQSIPGMFWRFLIHDDPNITRWLSRDADARVSHREAAAVSDWITSNRTLHIIRDHPCHCRSIMGGTIGMVARTFSMRRAIEAWGPTHEYANDEEFLEQRVLPILRNDVLVHDDFCMVGDHGLPTRPFPAPRNGDHFVGAIYDEMGRLHEGLTNMLRAHVTCV